jgi:hypothetical protein
MLKLEKISKTLEISIILRPKTPFLTHSLKWAFIIALSIHILIGLLFTVTLMKVSDPIQIYPPVFVESEGNEAFSNQALADLEREEMNFRYPGEPPDSKLTLPDYHFRAEESVIAGSIGAEIFKTDPFLKVEDWLLAPSIPLWVTSHSHNTPIQIKLGGGIEKYVILEEGRNSDIMGLLKKMKPERYTQTYHVRIDLHRGEIFWFEPIGISKSKKIDQMIERILSNIRFDVLDPSEAIGAGCIEITLFKQEVACD